MITWSAIYVALKNNWLDTEEVVNLINSNYKKQSWSEDLVIEINVNENEKKFILEKIIECEVVDESAGKEYWEILYLTQIKESDKTIKDKLIDIDNLWYEMQSPNEWRTFIYYLPNENSNSPEDVYLTFIEYLEKKVKNQKER